MNSTDEFVFGTVLGNEATCRVLLQTLIDRGVEINADHTKLTHEECAEVIIQIMSELKRKEQGYETK